MNWFKTKCNFVLILKKFPTYFLIWTEYLHKDKIYKKLRDYNLSISIQSFHNCPQLMEINLKINLNKNKQRILTHKKIKLNQGFWILKKIKINYKLIILKFPHADPY